jgi:hypothetical protein
VQKWVQVFNLHIPAPQVENLRPLRPRRLKTCGHVSKPTATSANLRPLASFQLPASNQSLVLPDTLVAQLRPLATTVTLARPCGATAATPPIWEAIASASLSVNCGTPPPPPPPMR